MSSRYQAYSNILKKELNYWLTIKQFYLLALKLRSLKKKIFIASIIVIGGGLSLMMNLQNTKILEK